MSKIITLTPKKPPKTRVGVIVQARMSSVRFPGKSMALLNGKPVLQWVLERCRLIQGRKNDQMCYILAVPDTDASEPMLELANQLGWDNFCGSELNVLRRYYEAAVFFKLDYIIRVTGDCPFIDPVVCTEVINLLVWRKLDYVSNIFPKRTYPKGLDCEAFTMDALEAAYKLSDLLGDHEHVTPWLQRTKDVIKGSVEQKEDKSNLNWCVDFPEDIERLEKEIKRIEEEKNKPPKKIHIIGANSNDKLIS